MPENAQELQQQQQEEARQEDAGERYFCSAPSSRRHVRALDSKSARPETEAISRPSLWTPPPLLPHLPPPYLPLPHLPLPHLPLPPLPFSHPLVTSHPRPTALHLQVWVPSFLAHPSHLSLQPHSSHTPTSLPPPPHRRPALFRVHHATRQSISLLLETVRGKFLRP